MRASRWSARFHYVAPKIEVVSIGSGRRQHCLARARHQRAQGGAAERRRRSRPDLLRPRRGTEVTLTDVMTPDRLHGPGRPSSAAAMTLDMPTAARQAPSPKQHRPARSGMDPVEEAAFGIFRVAAAQITDLIHEITVERGLDPRDFDAARLRRLLRAALCRAVRAGAQRSSAIADSLHRLRELRLRHGLGRYRA